MFRGGIACHSPSPLGSDAEGKQGGLVGVAALDRLRQTESGGGGAVDMLSSMGVPSRAPASGPETGAGCQGRTLGKITFRKRLAIATASPS
jgi:hypothetical protein